MTKLRKVTLCAECKHDGGWHYTDDLVPQRFRCPDLLNEPATSAERERDAAIAATRTSDPEAFAEAVRIIHETALGRAELSANEIRHRFDVNGIPRTKIAGAFRHAVARGWIKCCGQVESDDPATHNKPIDNYESRVFRAGREIA